jgi:hypothetical protein
MSRSGMRYLIDICSGEWGWSKAFADAGWTCLGIDIKSPSFVPERCVFIRRDIFSITSLHELLAELSWPKFDFGVASTPCENFSLFQLKNFHPNPPHPELGIRLFMHARSLFENAKIPHVMENVRAAEEFLGASVNKCGPFHLWGNAVPPLMPQGISKGMSIGSGNAVSKMNSIEKREYRKQFSALQSSGTSEKRKRQTAKWATIAPELAACVAEYAERINS